MSRDLAASLASRMDADEVGIYFAVDLLFSTAPLYFWTGYGDLDVDGKTYTGAGELLQFSPVAEDTEVSAKGLTISLSGIPSELLSVAISEPYQGRICNLYVGAVSNWTTAPLDPVQDLLFGGYMDQMAVEEGVETSTISLTVESRLVDLERPRSRRYSSESQKARHPGDKAFDFVPGLIGQTLTWGSG
jgi:hypothetical protein